MKNEREIVVMFQKMPLNFKCFSSGMGLLMLVVH